MRARLWQAGPNVTTRLLHPKGERTMQPFLDGRLPAPVDSADSAAEREFALEWDRRPAPAAPVKLSPLLQHPCCDPARERTVMSCQLCSRSATYWRTNRADGQPYEPVRPL